MATSCQCSCTFFVLVLSFYFYAFTTRDRTNVTHTVCDRCLSLGTYILFHFVEMDETATTWCVDLAALLSIHGQDKCVLINDDQQTLLL